MICIHTSFLKSFSAKWLNLIFFVLLCLLNSKTVRRSQHTGRNGTDESRISFVYAWHSILSTSVRGPGVMSACQYAPIQEIFNGKGVTPVTPSASWGRDKVPNIVLNRKLQLSLGSICVLGWTNTFLHVKGDFLLYFGVEERNTSKKRFKKPVGDSGVFRNENTDILSAFSSSSFVHLCRVY